VRNLLKTLGEAGGPGRRGVLAVPEIARLAHSSRLLEPANACVGGTARPVRAIYFDKTPRSNWAVAWHQDLTLAVRVLADVPEFGPWSLKDGVPHVQPPAELLEQMVTIRLHLDDCDSKNGALHVLPGTHRLGRLSGEQVQRLARQQRALVCNVPVGGALFMRPLLLHSSKRSQAHGHRRVLHIEYAGFELPKPLEWCQAA
jgi:phytanoyl-CoA dioxygenase PhyH